MSYPSQPAPRTLLDTSTSPLRASPPSYGAELVWGGFVLGAHERSLAVPIRIPSTFDCDFVFIGGVTQVPIYILCAARRRGFLSKGFAKPARFRLPRFRRGFHLLHHAQSLRRRGCLPPWLRAEFAKKGQLQTRRNRRSTARPALSLESPRRWKPASSGGASRARRGARPHPHGCKTRAQKRGENTGNNRKAVRGAVRRAGGGGEKRDGVRSTDRVLDVLSGENLPDVRWSVANAMADVTIPSLEQR
ncbi:hypothetical protein B0H19DRAFT_1236470 [Mycena capillaripes]|nr:hypothetical protein B0H19DRAFT_1236470 [Mycena capillaripes]